VVAGSAGKKTALAGSDFDLVVFLNNAEPPFTTVLSDIKSMLSSKLGINFSTIKTTRYSVQFETDGLEYDLLPAANKRKINKKKHDQMKNTLNCYYANDVRSIEDLNRLYGSGLTEFAISFISRSPEIILTVIRLAKYWNQMIDVGNEYISGRSTLIELVVLECNRRRKKRSVLTCFTRFLLGMANFKTLNITSFAYYSKDKVPDEILSQRPLILDPSNPNNNFANGLKREDGNDQLMEVFEDAARRTLQKLSIPLENAYVEIEDFINPGK